MTEYYISRSLEPILARAMREFPAVVLIGPRQSGKTTLVQHLAGTDRRLVSLEAPDVRAPAINDPRGFLDLYAPPVVYDEIRRGLMRHSQRAHGGAYASIGTQDRHDTAGIVKRPRIPVGRLA